MNASDIIKNKNNSTLYKSYTQLTNRLSNPNTRPDIIIPNQYECNDFINYQLKNSVAQGEYACGDKQISELKFSTAPKVCPNTNFNQEVSNTFVSLKFSTAPKVCPNIQFYQGVDTCDGCCGCSGVCDNS